MRRTCARHAAQSLTPSAIPEVDFFEFYSRDLNFKKEVVAVTSCEKKLEEKTAELEVLKKEMEGFKREMGYLKQINELLVKK